MIGQRADALFHQQFSTLLRMEKLRCTAAGNLADLVVLSQDIFAMPMSQLPKTDQRLNYC